MKKPNRATKRIGIVRLILRSLVCTFGGWCVLIAYAHLHFYFSYRLIAEKTRVDFVRMGMEGWQPPRPSWSWLGMPSAITTVSLPYIAVVWLFMVLPLFIFIKPSSWLWK